MSTNTTRLNEKEHPEEDAHQHGTRADEIPVLDVPRFLITSDHGRQEVHFCYNSVAFRAIPVRRVEDGWIVKDPIAVDHKSHLWFSFVQQEVRLRGEPISDVLTPLNGGEA